MEERLSRAGRRLIFLSRRSKNRRCRMDLEEFREVCLAKPGATEGTPFGPDNIVFKVGGKMFALASLDEVPPRVNLKCDPDLALEFRDRYEEVRPGYHMNKKHWNTVERSLLRTGARVAHEKRADEDRGRLLSDFRALSSRAGAARRGISQASPRPTLA